MCPFHGVSDRRRSVRVAHVARASCWRHSPVSHSGCSRLSVICMCTLIFGGRPVLFAYGTSLRLVGVPPFGPGSG